MTADIQPNTSHPTSTLVSAVMFRKSFINITAGIARTGWYQVDFGLAGIPFPQNGTFSGTTPLFSLTQRLALTFSLSFLNPQPTANPFDPCGAKDLKCTGFLIWSTANPLYGSYHGATADASLSGTTFGMASAGTCPTVDLRSQINGSTVSSSLYIDF